MVMTKSQSLREFSFGMDHSWYSKLVGFMLMTKSQIFSGVLLWNEPGWEFSVGMDNLWYDDKVI